MLDVHCHLDLYPDPESLAEQCERAGITTIAMTNRPSYYELAVRHLGGMTHVRPALGLHPLETKIDLRAELALFRRLVVGADLIGEVGLDFSSAGSGFREEQLGAFSAVMACLGDRPRMVSLYSRRAEAEVVRMAAEVNVGQPVLHRYGGPVSVLERALGLGFLFSVSPATVRSERGRDLVRRLPPDRVLTESDGPYVRVGAEPARPQDVDLVLRALADCWGGDVAEAEAQVAQNLARVLRLCGTTDPRPPG